MTCLYSLCRLTVVEVGEEGFQPPKNLSMYDWLNFLRLRLNGLNTDSFILWRVKVVSVGSGSELTHYSCFTAENPNINVAAMYNFLKPLPSHSQHRLEVPRRASIYLLSQTHGEYIAEPCRYSEYT